MDQQRPDNNFDILRLSAAVAVLISHSVPLTYGSNAREPLFRWSGGQTTLGGVAVGIFFVASGYLITQSWQRRPVAQTFIQARVLRLVPALAANLLILAFAVGPMLTALPVAEYFQHSNVPRFLAKIFMIGYTTDLPGVFASHPKPGVNASLWTLPYEARCYAVILLLGLSGLLNRWMILALWAASAIAAGLAIGADHAFLTSLFLGGGAMQVWKPRLDGRIALASLAIVVAGVVCGAWQAAAVTGGVYLVIYVALGLHPVPSPTGRADLSYGIYLWAFPVQQIATMILGSHASWSANIVLSLPPVLLLAWASWRWVEAPAMSLRNVNLVSVATTQIQRLKVSLSSVEPTGQEREAERRGDEDASHGVFAPPREGDRTREAYLRAHSTASAAERSW